MNEEQKNIETCLAENILDEVANVPTDPQFVSLTDEALDPLKQQALQQAGYDGYEKVVWTHKPYTFTSQVKQMKSNLILLLRRLWRFPFGRGTTASSAAGSSAASSAAGSSAASSAAAPIRSLADMWQHYIHRLKGNAEYGIPSRLSQLTDLPAAPALLADRKIGEPNAIEGISLAQILGGAYMPHSIKDYTKGWVLVNPILGTFKDVKLGCKTIEVASVNYSTTAVVNATGSVSFDELETCYSRCLLNGGSGDTLVFHKLTSFRANDARVAAISGCNYKRLIFPVLTDYRDGNHYYGNSTGLVLNSPGVEYIECDVLPKTNGSGNVNLFYNNASLKEINLPGFTNHNISIMRNCPELTTLRLGKITAWSVPSRGDWDAEYDEFKQEKKLILIEFGQGSSASINLANWSPTLDDSNLQQFLSNFKTYIAERLTDKGSGKTLTISQEVRNAIHAAETEYGIENIIITKKGWTISPAPN